MKKLFYLFSATLLAFTSCTNEYEGSCIAKNNVNPIKNDTISPEKKDSIPLIVGPILVKKLVHNYVNGKSSTLEFSYDGTKIVTDRDQSNVTFYTYTDDKITKIEKADNLGNLYSIIEYVYAANGKVDYIFSYELGNYYKTKYIYNNDATVFYYKINSDSSKNDLVDTGITGTYTFSEGNLIKEQLNNGSFQSVITYEYDSQNNPRVNILGANLLTGLNQGFAANNVSKKITQIMNAGINTFTETITYSYEYDANGYPVKQTQTTQNGSQITTETSLYSY